MRFRSTLTVALAAAALFALAGQASAAITVANTNDSGPGSLRQAIVDAPGGETISIPAGDYVVSSEPLLIEKNLTLAGAASATTTVRSTGPFRVFTIKPPAMEKLNVTLSGMTIRDGRVFEAAAIGAGISAINANLTLRGVNLTGNIANANGEAPGEDGGTAAGAGAAVIAGTLTVADSRVTGNLAESNGGPEAEGGSTQGGALTVLNGSVTIERSTISGNVARANGGQGPSNAGQKGGVAAGAGLLLLAESTPATIVASTISGNTAEALPGPGGDGGEGAAGAAFIITKQQVAITNATISGNVVKSGPSSETPGLAGGLLAIIAETGTVTVTSSTIAANRLEGSMPNSIGGNLLAAGAPNSFALRNSIISGGVGPAGSENCGTIPEAPAFVSQGFNLESLDQCGLKAVGDQVNKDPLLLPLQSFGGPTETMAPAAGSPIVDQGAAFGQAADQRGIVRPIDLPSIPNSTAAGADGSDIGAFELQPPSSLTLGKLAKNKKKGTATLTVTLPAPSAGVLTLKGKGLKTRTVKITGQSSLKLKIEAKGGTKKALRKKGKRKVKFEVAYAPTANTVVTQKRTTKLLKKIKKPKPKE